MEIVATERNIPTLTDIVELGNEDMINHFDASFFDEDDAQELETSGDATIEPDEIASEDLAAENPVDDAPATEHQAAENLADTIDEIIESVLDQALPLFREELKQQLTTTILQKLEEKTE